MKRLFKFLFILIFLLGLGLAGLGYYSILTPNTTQQTEFKIYPGSSFSDVLENLKSNNLLKNASTFAWVSMLMKYDRDDVPSGNYRITEGMTNRKLVGMLRSGRQEAIQITFNNVRDIYGLSKVLSDQLAFDSAAFVKAALDAVLLQKLGKDSSTVLTTFVPDTYEAYWNSSPEKFINKMNDQQKAFWKKNNRISKAQSLGLSEEQVYTLASIVEKESQLKSERPTIAGLYLNRLGRGILLQADPTVVFANQDFGIRRVLNKHLEKDSPYNTYLYPGLPPGPIYMPSIESIDAVLNPEKHGYLYMCAKPGYSGEHLFATNLAAHTRNARIYQNWLNQQQIMR